MRPGSDAVDHLVTLRGRYPPCQRVNCTIASNDDRQVLACPHAIRRASDDLAIERVIDREHQRGHVTGLRNEARDACLKIIRSIRAAARRLDHRGEFVELKRFEQRLTGSNRYGITQQVNRRAKRKP